jgi:protein AFG1
MKSVLRRARSTHRQVLGICSWFEPSTTRYNSTRSLLPSQEPLSIREILAEQINRGELQRDKAQESLAKRLSRLENALVGYDNSVLFQSLKEKKKDKEKVETEKKPSPSNENEKEKSKDPGQESVNIQIPRGLYCHGPVGTGKTMMIDFFFEHTSIEKKKRFHFHSFLAHVHDLIHQLKQRDLKEKGRNFSIDTSKQNNPIHRVGLELASQMSLLCLDEFQVTDIADAVILSQLFGVLFTKGTVVVATSNRPPSDLYEGGLNRNYFLPFIDMLETHCIVHQIKSQVDYRRVLEETSSFFVTQDDLLNIRDELILQMEGRINVPECLELQVGSQRTFQVKRSYGRLACFTVEELCDKELGAMDYRAIAQEFDMVVLEDIPTLDLEGHNRARRFITLIDELYEGKCALLCSSVNAETPMDLFQGTTDTHYRQRDDPETIIGVDVAVQGGTPVGALASVRELSFAFERASSRLYEMTSRPWWNRLIND